MRFWYATTYRDLNLHSIPANCESAGGATPFIVEFVVLTNTCFLVCGFVVEVIYDLG